MPVCVRTVQPIGLLIGVLTSRVPGRDGMKGIRVGEASNPGPVDDQLAPTADDSFGGFSVHWSSI